MKLVPKNKFVRFFAILAIIGVGLSFFISPLVTICYDDEADNNEKVFASNRPAIEQTAAQFVKDLIANHSESAYEVTSSEVKSTQTPELFKTFIQQAILPNNFSNTVKLEHTYLAEVRGGKNEVRVTCGKYDSPHNWVALNAKPNAKTAYVLLNTETPNNSWTFIVWLVQEENTWRVQGAYPTLTGMAGKSANDLWTIARQEKTAGHNLNTYMLYAGALDLAGRGANFQLGIQPEIGKELQTLQSPFPQRPPFDLSLDGKTYKILGGGPVGIDGNISLLLHQEVDHWGNDQEVIDTNKRFLTSFAKKYPEYQAVFADIIVRAHEHGTNRLYESSLKKADKTTP